MTRTSPPIAYEDGGFADMRLGQVDAAGDWSPDLLKAKAYEQLLLDITLGVLPPGARLDEQQVAARYGLGLAGVRDALGRLALERLVVRRQRFGTIVAPIDLAEVKQAFEARMLIEPHVARLAAANAGRAEIDAIQAAFADAEAAVHGQDYRAMVLMDQAFHRAVASAGGNLALMRILTGLHHCTARLWRFTLPQRTPDQRLADIALHRAVGDAIGRRDGAQAEAAMRVVVGTIPDSLYQAVAGAPEEVAVL